jgi:hypothetical protein
MSSWNILAQRNRLLIYLQNLFLEKYLSISDKNWGWYLCHPITKALQEEHKLRGSCKKTRRLLVAEKKRRRGRISLFH